VSDNFIKIDSRLLKKISQRNFFFNIHSKYKNTINLQNKNGKIFVCLSNSNFAGPHRININNFLSFFDCEQINSKISLFCDTDKLFINNFTFEFSNLEVVDVSLRKFTDFEKENLFFNRSKLREFFLEKYFIDFENDVIYKKIFEILKHSKNNINFLINLIGLGYGLTPSGDDILLGFIIFSHIRNKIQSLNFLKEHFYKTNQISQFYLFNAFQKYFDELILNFIYSLTEKDFNNNYYNILLNYGHTSGKDILCGFFYYD